MFTLLHSELSALSCAMESVIQLYSLNYFHVETDCTKLIKAIDDEELWHAFATELDSFNLICSRFRLFSIHHISMNNI